uniref:Uncharacterized protein n=1 Tax=Zea mays TaxID=4577 RepID=B4FB41_MAIZE|nr:unknown [Zea mays]|eukprot:NP_001130941.1 exostosin-like protein [Zea mays]
MWERGRPPRKPRPSPILVPPPPSSPPPRPNLLLPRSLLALAARAMPSRRPSPVLLLLLALSLALLFLLLSPSFPSTSRFSRSLSSGSAFASSSPASTSAPPAPVKIYLLLCPTSNCGTRDTSTRRSGGSSRTCSDAGRRTAPWHAWTTRATPTSSTCPSSPLSALLSTPSALRWQQTPLGRGQRTATRPCKRSC